ncbi:MAG: transposase [Patescibacteria group bacterium]
MNQLAEKYRVHPLTIRNRLHQILDKTPPISKDLSLPDRLWLITDATHFKRWGCLLITRATTIIHPLAISFHFREDQSSVLEHLRPLSKLTVVGYTTDGKRGLVTAYQQVFPEAKQQRCLVHIRMRVQTLLTSQPKLTAGQELLNLIKLLNPIKDAVNATAWWELFSEWYETNLPTINERSHRGKSWWYTHKNLRKAARHVLNAADNLFVFINQPNSVSNTNHLEGLFGQRKPALVRHRGLSRKRVANTLLWTFHLLSKKH